MSEILDKIFDSLVKNAFDFLEHSLKDFDRSPKLSLIHFCAAVEIFLKARLMKEDWSLIVDKPDRADFKRFVSGDFTSTTIGGLEERLKNIATEKITEETFINFKKLAKHRNKLIHFFNEGLDNPKIRSEIAAEQCKSWYHLSLLLKKWCTYFANYNKKILYIEGLMKQHVAFLSEKYQDILPTIQVMISSGREFLPCYVCAFDAMPKFVQSQGIAWDSQCMLCDSPEMQFYIQCKGCSTPIFFRHNIDGVCSECGYEVNESNVVSVLETQLGYYADIKHGDEVDWIANCTECDSMNSVIKITEHKWLCTACFTIHQQAECCEFCNERHTGSNDDSYLKGCGFCDGNIAWQMDKHQDQG